MRAVLRCFLIALAFLLFGCSGRGPSERLDAWSFRVAGQTARAVTLPGRFDEVLGGQPTSYVLETDVALDPDLVGRDIEVAFPSFKGIGTLHANGEVTVRLDATMVDRHRSSRLLRFAVPRSLTQSGRVHLALDVPYV